ncbi:hypothetical protein HYW35_00975 [Candidatus Saccharibacteria bacterium]|nr:hypothetical protein [Candidatus Saccharibacteria bacterium]
MSGAKVAVLASGEGTTTEALIRAGVKEPSLPQVGLVICNNKDAGIFRRIANLNSEYGLSIKTALINSKTHPDTNSSQPGLQTAQEEKAIVDLIKDGGFELVLLMGYMKMIGQRLVYKFGWRSEYKSPYQAMMLNTHPGLLPATKGLIGIHVQEFVLAHPAQKAGHTLHAVSKNYDEGPTIAEHKVPVGPADTAEILFERVKQSQKKHLPKDLSDFIEKRRHFYKVKNEQHAKCKK